jgi:MFS superfamily sulfate permease-like transporter
MTLSAPQLTTGFQRYVPGLASIVEGVRTSVLADTRGALTVWAIVVPQSLAYATLAGVASVHGLYTAIGALAAYAVFGTCRDLNMGAESTVALMTAAAVAPLVTGSRDAVELTALVARWSARGASSASSRAWGSSASSCRGRSSPDTCSGRESSS